jgi:5'-3' exonuclease
MGDRLSYAGSPTTILYTFLRDMIALQEQFRTSGILFCFDSKSSKRKEIYPKYKQKRHTKELTEEEIEFEKAFRYQIKKLRMAHLPEIGYRNIYRKAGFESDDLIAKLGEDVTREGKNKGVVVSSDHDLFQCITPFVSFYNPADHKELTLQGFRQKYGITPDQWAMVKAIAGCNTDEVEGVRGIGEKTAIKYIQGELKESSKAHANITCENGQEIIKRNWGLVKLPLAGTPELEIKPDELSLDGWLSVCKKLGFKSLRNENPFPWSRLK